MKVEKKDLKKSEIELTVEISLEEFKPFIEKGAEKISKEVKIDGFRPGNVPLDVLKQKVGEMGILEESARLAINAKLGEILKEHIEGEAIGQPRVDITKLAPNNPLEFKAIIAILPKLELCDYKNVKTEKQKVSIDPKELEKTLNDIREMRVKEALADRAIKEGDKVMVSIKMFQDNVPLEGGQAKETPVIIGKDYIIPGFDKELIGKKKGEEKEFSLPYPKDHHMKNLAGKMVDFKVSIGDVFERELPELDDEFAKSLGLKKFEELKDSMEKNILAQKEKEADNQVEKKMFDTMIEKTKFDEIPQSIIDHENNTMMRELEHNVVSQGMQFEDYLKSINKTRDQLVMDLLPQAISRVKVSLLIREVSIKEKIEATEEDIAKHLKDMEKQYEGQAEMIERLKAPEYKTYAANVLTSQKVVDALKKWNIK